MRIGAALFLIALGAILKFAITKHLNGIDLGVVGVILIIIGAIGLLFEVIMMTNRRRTTVVRQAPGVTYVDPVDRIDRNY